MCEQNSSSVSFSTPPTRLPDPELPGELKDLNTERPGVRGELGLTPAAGEDVPTVTLPVGELEKL